MNDVGLAINNDEEVVPCICTHKGHSEGCGDRTQVDTNHAHF